MAAAGERPFRAFVQRSAGNVGVEDNLRWRYIMHVEKERDERLFERPITAVDPMITAWPFAEEYSTAEAPDAARV